MELGVCRGREEAKRPRGAARVRERWTTAHLRKLFAMARVVSRSTKLISSSCSLVTSTDGSQWYDMAEARESERARETEREEKEECGTTTEQHSFSSWLLRGDGVERGGEGAVQSLRGDAAAARSFSGGSNSSG